jgi:glycosyltransferase involved in cell wall biosynthesis
MAESSIHHLESTGARAKVGIFVASRLSRADGTSFRARAVLSCLDGYFRIYFVGIGVSSTIYSDPEWLLVNVPERETQLFQTLLRLPFWLVGVGRILIRHKFDMVYVCNDWYGLLVYVIFQKMFKRKVIFEVHGILSDESKARWGKQSFVAWFPRCWETIMLRGCDLVIALSWNISRFYERYAQRVELVTVFVDTNVFRRNEDSRVILRERHGWQGKRVVGLIGPFEEKTFFVNESTLQFLEENIEKFDERIVFAIIGECERKKNAGRWFYAGFVEGLPDFLSCLDAVLVPRRVSTSGPLNKIIQSMSCSLPVFATPEAMLGMDYAEHGRDIIVANESEMARTVNTLIFDDDLMRTIGEKARETVEKHYSYGVNAARLVRILESFRP